MSLSELRIHHVRNIVAAQLFPNPHCNVFYGLNGSGKTSLLEAIYLLGSGHSFRTRDISPLINSEATSLTVFARNELNDSISLQKARCEPTQVKLNQSPCVRSSLLAQTLPCQVVYQDLFQIIDAGPSVRRSLLDWGLFHVKPSYHAAWKDYRRVLKQRNALLRQKAPLSQFEPWDHFLVDLAGQLDQFRENYMIDLSKEFQRFLLQLTPIPCRMVYYKGWDKRASGHDLASILIEQRASDRLTQYTHSGAHQADILFESDLLKAKQTLSRGQQKIILIALKLAQSHLLSKTCLYLFDDLVSELDSVHQQRLMDCLCGIKGQFFLTTTDKNMAQELCFSNKSGLFSVEEGVFRARSSML